MDSKLGWTLRSASLQNPQRVLKGEKCAQSNLGFRSFFGTLLLWFSARTQDYGKTMYCEGKMTRLDKIGLVGCAICELTETVQRSKPVSPQFIVRRRSRKQALLHPEYVGWTERAPD